MKLSFKKFDFKVLKNFKFESVAIIAGVLILLFVPTLFDKSDNTDSTKNDANQSNVSLKNDSAGELSYADAEAKRLKSVLKNIKGVGDADVIIYVETSLKTVNASEIQTTEENTDEGDSNGGKRVNSRLEESSVYKVVKDSDGNERLVHIYDEYPEIKGILISAEGADKNTVKETVIEAVSSLYGIPVHKISVVKKAGKN